MTMTQPADMANNEQQIQQELQDAGSILAMGAGVGTVGTASALLLGATCPICVVMAPALIGMGLVKGYVARKKRAKLGADGNDSSQKNSSEG
ncbi:MAG: hypothetical protein U0936_04320 [Planctomycetaceae bacterium]